MVNREDRFSMRELSEATGLTVGALNYHARAMGIKCGRNGMTYETAKEIMRFQRKKNPRYSKQRVDRLRLQLKTDGFNVK